MPLRVGILSTAHLHVWSYVHALKLDARTELVGLWDDDADRAISFAKQADTTRFESRDELLDAVDAVVICSENLKHLENIIAAAEKGKDIICEKPIAPTEEHAQAILDIIEKTGVKVMTAFPCRYSPAFQSMKTRIAAGEIGAVKAICATNRGSCPFGWFVDTSLSGGGAMIDHVVHVMDLLRDLLGEEPVRVQAQTSHHMYGKEWDDCAMVTIEFGSGIFATLDSSWSRPQQFKTWGDVTMNVIGEKGVIELNMFGQGLDYFHPGDKTHTLSGYGTSLDGGMINDFISACLGETPVKVSAYDGIQAARVAMRGYDSLKTGQPVAV